MYEIEGFVPDGGAEDADGLSFGDAGGFFGLWDLVHLVDQDVDERVGAVHVELLHGLLVDLPIHLEVTTGKLGGTSCWSEATSNTNSIMLTPEKISLLRFVKMSFRKRSCLSVNPLHCNTPSTIENIKH